MAGVVIYVGVDILLQRLPPHYSAIREAESNLAVGPYGWIMNVNFLGRAATTLCVVQAVARTGTASRSRTAGAALLGIGGACSAVLAFFPTDIEAADVPLGALGTAHSSTAGTVLAVDTAAGTVHVVVAAAGFLTALAGIGVLTVWLRRCPRLRGTARLSTVFAAITATGLISLGLTLRFIPAFLGLAERIALAGILGWAYAVSAGIRSLPADD